MGDEDGGKSVSFAWSTLTNEGDRKLKTVQSVKSNPLPYSKPSSNKIKKKKQKKRIWLKSSTQNSCGSL
jgi:hypothetical protein